MMSRVQTGRNPMLRGALVSLLLAIAVIAVPTAKAAEGERVLDPALSLIGGCKAETLDPVEDPGCPGGTHPGIFSDPRAVTTDAYGNIYVSTFGSLENGSKGRIDIFDPDGFFIEGFTLTSRTSVAAGPMALAVDSKGYLYVVAALGPERRIYRLKPDTPYEPETGIGNVAYSTAAVQITLAGPECPSFLCEFRSSAAASIGLTVNPEDDHLFANFGGGGIAEYSSAEEGNEEVRSIFAGGSNNGSGVDINDERDELYASMKQERIDIFDLNTVVGTPPNDQYEKVGTIDGSDTPAGNLGSELSVAVDEGTGHVFILDGENTKLYEFDEDGNYITTIEFPFQRVFAAEIAVDNGPFSPNGALGDGIKGRYLYVPSHRTGTGHSFAFRESNVDPSEVKSVAAVNVSETEAELTAQVNPHNLETTYSFEYISEQAAAKNEVEAKEAFAGAILAGGGTLAGNLDAEASAPATGLAPDTSYRFRIIAENELGEDEAEGSFSTYPSLPAEPTPCANALLRTGPSALLPDCRAYELVTPPDTNARAPVGTLREPGAFVNRQVSPAGDKVPFHVEGGTLPGLGGVGAMFGDPYLATRTDSGWITSHIGPTGEETTSAVPGTTSPDQGYSFYTAEVSGPLVVVPGWPTSYVRYPDGHSELLGQGSLGNIDPEAVGQLISEGGGHIIFHATSLRELQKVTLGKQTTGGTFTLAFQGQSTGPIAYDASAAAVRAALEALPGIGTGNVTVTDEAGAGPEGGPYVVRFTGSLSGVDVPQLTADPSGLTVSSGEGSVTVVTMSSAAARPPGGGGRLEPEAPEEGRSVYDRTPDGTTHVVSLKPSGEPFAAGEDAFYQGASLNGVGIAFKVGNTLFLRYDNQETFEIGNGVGFAGVVAGGNRIFYVEGGDLKAFDVEEEAVSVFADIATEVIPVNVASDGTAAYFVSETAVAESGPNPEGDEPQAGEQNLYLSDEGQISFLGIVTERDVLGTSGPSETVDGLGLWVTAASPIPSSRFSLVPARATPDGKVLLFKSRASLTGYDSEEHAQIYRYDSVADKLQCLSCNPTGAPAKTDATLQSERREGSALFHVLAWLENMRADGRRAFFESSEPLVPGDGDGLRDVYEWEDQGVGSCTRPEGCVYLISSPRSSREEYLWAVSSSGDDVFFLSTELLVGSDVDATPSIYDARVGGGFAEKARSDCAGEGCRPRLTPPPSLPPALTPVLGSGDDAKPLRCGKGKRKVKRDGKVRCVKKKHKKAKAKSHHHRAGSDRKGGHR